MKPDVNTYKHLLLALVLFATLGSAYAQSRVTYTHQQMGTQIRLVFYAPDSIDADRVAQLAFKKIDDLNLILSDYLPNSELNNLSKTVHTKVPVSKDLFQLLHQSSAMSDATAGAFDITAGPVVALWRKARKNGVVPTTEEIEAAKKKVGYNKIRLLPDSLVSLSTLGMQLDVGGIGKGYAADEVIQLLKKMGVASALVDMGGDITVSGAPPDKAYWVLGFSYYNSLGEEAFTKLKLKNKSVATSGDLYQYFTVDGKRYSHIVDPSTGMAITNTIQVTTIAPTGAMADAYASALSVLGIEKSKNILKQTPGLEAFLVTDSPADYEQWNSQGFLDYIISD